MATRTKVRSVMVEILRLGGESAIMEKGRTYIQTMGDNRPNSDVALGLDHREFVRNLRKLRYRSEVPPADIDKAIATLAAEAAKMVPNVSVGADETVQIDLVSGAAELWAFPFEACFHDDIPLLADEKRRVVLTRRIRNTLAEQKLVWPTRPRILFIHAAKADDLKPGFVDEHVRALKDALKPWTGGREPDEKLLVVREVYSAAELRHERKANGGDWTHIHFLAHGQTILDPETGEDEWGVRLGAEGSEGVRPQEIAAALYPENGRPVVITLASCDSANQANSAMPTYSLAQELHRCGVPIVVGSQLPLTKPGSVLLAKHFYEAVLKGEDARNALYDVRRALYENANVAGHDWLSVVSYVRLPEGYAATLMEIGIATELEMLKAAQSEADRLIQNPDDAKKLETIEQLLRDRIASLQSRLNEVDPDATKVRQECEGVLASAHKRLAELYFRGAPHVSSWSQNHNELARAELEKSLEHYRTAFKFNIHNHWLGVQQLALEAVLYGKFSTPAYWSAVLLGAQLDQERNYWAYGTIAEIEFIRELAEHPADGEAVRKALSLLREKGDDYAVETTRRQFARYLDWWTPANGYFPECGKDFRTEAEALVQLLAARDRAKEENG